LLLSFHSAVSQSRREDIYSDFVFYQKRVALEKDLRERMIGRNFSLPLDSNTEDKYLSACWAVSQFLFDANGNLLSVVPNCTETMVIKNQIFSMPSSNPCSFVPGILTFDYTNSIFHVNVNGASDVWVTQTQTGSITFVPTNALQPSYAGHITIWFGASLNKNNFVFHDTFNATLRGTDGSTITFHMVDHMSVSATGMTNAFSIGGRGSYALSKNLKFLTEIGFSQKKPQGAESENLTKITIGPALSTGPDFWKRPELRLYVTYADFNKAAALDPANGLPVNKTNGTSYGAQVEIWF